MKAIIYPSTTTIAVFYPSPSCPLPIEEMALKNVPPGIPFCIVDTSEIPSDRSQRELWSADFSDPDGYGADYGVGSDYAPVVYDNSGNARGFQHLSHPGKIIYKRSASSVKVDRASVTMRGNTKITVPQNI